jgi:hypothetical protein
VAIEQNLTNIEKQKTAKKQAELNTQEAMIDQKKQEVLQETEKLVAEIGAQRDKLVAEINANTEKKSAEIALKTASVQAEITRNLGETKSRVITMVDGEKANGFKMKVEALGDSKAYAWMTFAENLNPDISVRILHSGEGTLWTDLNGDSLGKLGGAKILSTPEKK